MRRCKNWVHKIFFWKYLSQGVFCQFFPEHRGPHSWSSCWTLFRICQRSAIAAASDLMLVEADGKCPCLVGSPLSKIFKRKYCKAVWYVIIKRKPRFSFELDLIWARANSITIARTAKIQKIHVEEALSALQANSQTTTQVPTRLGQRESWLTFPLPDIVPSEHGAYLMMLKGGRICHPKYNSLA